MAYRFATSNGDAVTLLRLQFQLRNQLQTPSPTPSPEGFNIFCPVYANELNSPLVDPKGGVFTFAIDRNQTVYLAVYCAPDHVAKVYWRNTNVDDARVVPPIVYLSQITF